jgi:hypothetical protein
VGYQHVQDSASIDMSWSRKRGVKIGIANNIAFQNYAFLGRLIVPDIHFYTPISASRKMRLWLSTYLLELGQEPADYKQVRGKPVPGLSTARLGSGNVSSLSAAPLLPSGDSFHPIISLAIQHKIRFITQTNSHVRERTPESAIGL